MFPSTIFFSSLHTKLQSFMLFHEPCRLSSNKNKIRKKRSLSTFWSPVKGILLSTCPSQVVWLPIVSDYKNPINGKLSREQNLLSQNTGRYKSSNEELIGQDYLKMNWLNLGKKVLVSFHTAELPVHPETWITHNKEV